MKVYLDNHSATRIDDLVLEEMLPYLKDDYGNAQSLHELGQKAKEAIETARERVSKLINCLSQEIIFTSCGSEANNLAIKGSVLLNNNTNSSKHIIVSSIEHLSVLYSARRMKQLFGVEYSLLPVDSYGIVKLDELKNLLRENTVLVSIQLANPEIGTIQPIKYIAEIIREFNNQKKNKQIKTLFHTDAIAACGIIGVDVQQLGVDMLSLAGSQFHGPKGAAVLFLKKGTKIIPQIDGGVQEDGRRAGTENVACIVGLGKAAEIAKLYLEKNYNKILNLRDKLIKEVLKKVSYTYLNGHPTQRLPNNINFSFEFVEGEGILLLLSHKGIYVTSGSACTSKALKLSHILEAIGVDPAVGQGSVTFTLSRYNTDEEIDYVVKELPPVIERLREFSPLYSHFLKTGERMQAGPGTEYEEEHHHNEDIN